MADINKDIKNNLNRMPGSPADNALQPGVQDITQKNVPEHDIQHPPLKKAKRMGRKSKSSQLTIDEIEEQEEEKAILHLLKVCFSEAVYPLILAMIKERCFGCQVDHPSQIEHDICLMTEHKERVDMFFQEAFDTILLDEVILDGVYSQWMRRVNEMFPCKVPNSLLSFRKDAWKA